MSHKLIDKLSDLSDISGTPTDGQVLTYQSSSADWQPATASGGGAPQFIQYSKQEDTDVWVGKLLDTTWLNSGRTVLIDNVRSGAIGSEIFPAGTYRFQYSVSARSSIANLWSGLGGGDKQDGYGKNLTLGGGTYSGGTSTVCYNKAEQLGTSVYYWDPQSICNERQNTEGYTTTLSIDFIF